MLNPHFTRVRATQIRHCRVDQIIVGFTDKRGRIVLEAVNVVDQALYHEWIFVNELKFLHLAFLYLRSVK